MEAWILSVFIVRFFGSSAAGFHGQVRHVRSGGTATFHTVRERTAFFQGFKAIPPSLGPAGNAPRVQKCARPGEDTGGPFTGGGL